MTQSDLIIRLKNYFIAILSNRNSVTGKSHMIVTDTGYEGLIWYVISGSKHFFFQWYWALVEIHVISHLFMESEKTELTETESRMVMARGQKVESGEWEDVGQRAPTFSYTVNMLGI